MRVSAGVPLALAAVLSTPGPVAAQGLFRIRDYHGELGLHGSGTRELGSFRSFRSEQRARLFAQGTLGDSSVASFVLELAPGFSQSRGLGADAGIAAQDGRVLGFGTYLRLLPYGRLATFTVDVRRGVSTNQLAFAGERRVENRTLAVTLENRNPYLPFSLAYSTESRETDFISATGNRFGIRGTVHRSRFRASNSKTRLRAERRTWRDRISGVEQRTLEGSLDHRARWGKGSSLLTTLGFQRNRGDLASSQVGWSEQVHLQHTGAVWSNLGWRFRRSKLRGDVRSQRFANWAFSGQPRRNLSAGLSLALSSTRNSSSSTRSWAVSPRAGLGIRLPLRASLRLNGSVGYQRFHAEAIGDPVVFVVDEPHVVDETERIRLENLSVETMSVSVRNPSGSIRYDRGLDYELIEQPPFLDLVALPGGRITVGDTLLVSYRFLGDPTSDGTTVSTSYGAVLRVSAFQFHYRRSLRKPRGSTEGGPESLAFGFRDDVQFGVSFFFHTPLGTLTGTAEHSTLELARFRTVSTTFRTSLRNTISPTMWATVGATANRSRGRGTDQSVVQGTSTVQWVPGRGWTLRGTLGGWWWSRADGTRTYLIGGGLDAAWRVGLLEISARYSGNIWRDGSDRSREIISLGVVRRF